MQRSDGLPLKRMGKIACETQIRDLKPEDRPSSSSFSRSENGTQGKTDPPSRGSRTHSPPLLWLSRTKTSQRRGQLQDSPEWNTREKERQRGWWNRGNGTSFSFLQAIRGLSPHYCTALLPRFRPPTAGRVRVSDENSENLWNSRELTVSFQDHCKARRPPRL